MSACPTCGQDPEPTWDQSIGRYDPRTGKWSSWPNHEAFIKDHPPKRKRHGRR